MKQTRFTFSLLLLGLFASSASAELVTMREADYTLQGLAWPYETSASFQTFNSTSITSVSIYSIGAYGPSSVEAFIYTDNNGQPGNQLARIVSNFSMPGESWVTFTDNMPLAVSTGTSLWLVVHGLSGWYHIAHNSNQSKAHPHLDQISHDDTGPFPGKLQDYAPPIVAVIEGYGPIEGGGVNTSTATIVELGPDTGRMFSFGFGAFLAALFIGAIYLGRIV